MRRVGGPLQYLPFLYLGVSLLGSTHSLIWHVLGAILVAGSLPLFLLSVWRFLRAKPVSHAGEFAGDRPIVGIEPADRGEWDYSPSAAGTEIELALRGRRWTAFFPPAETRAYRTVIAGITETLNSGVPSVDVNAAFQEVIGREPFAGRGPVPPPRWERAVSHGRSR